MVIYCIVRIKKKKTYRLLSGQSRVQRSSVGFVTLRIRTEIHSCIRHVVVSGDDDDDDDR